MIASGVIGQVREAHIWTDRPGAVWPQAIPDVLPEEPIRENLEWNLWIGSAPMRPYNAGYCPRKWRGWWDFGCGALGDMGCHNINPAWCALHLAEAKHYSVEVVKQEGNNEQTGPSASVLRYAFPARGDLGAVEVFWYDGGLLPERPEGLPADETLGDGSNGSLFIGTDGVLTCSVHGGGARLLPAAKMNDYAMPAPTLPRIPEENHNRDWLDACKGGRTACSNFDYAVPLTEMVLLGNVALRLGHRVEVRRGTGNGSE